MGTRRDLSAQGWYFSPTDGGIEHSIDDKAFRDSLMFHLLFEPEPLVIPDVFFFNCRYLINHIEGSGSPIFLRALRSGLIKPAFRSGTTETFAQSLEEIGVQRILGIEENQYTNDPRELAARLDHVFDISRPSSHLVWPENMGAAFGNVLRRVLTEQGELAVDSIMLRAMWSRLEPFRVDAIEEARRVTELTGGIGVRRAEVWNTVGRRLGFLSADEYFDKPRDLLVAVKRTDRKNNTPLYPDMVFFVDMVNLCYQQSQAQQFQCGHNIPGALGRHAAPLFPSLRRRAWNDAPIAFEMIVKLPAMTTLALADSGAIISVRDGDPAQRYFEMRAAWVREPTSAREESLRQAIRGYAAELSNVARGPQKSTRIGMIRTIARPVAELAGTVLTTGAGVIAGATIEVPTMPKLFGAVVGGMAGAAVGSAGATVVKIFQELRPGPHVPKEPRHIEIESVLESPDLNIPTIVDSGLDSTE
ncbi:hypothetical protein Aple_103900 [Acrocarpospora pleiomorpha]|uniref:Uncharacterized protein n=1 Tax=Acrocarpospora pleiomorpha TaxID=90975 RepID=A0A5M3Y2I2_9ACTN|nr:hypothetical protein [Acrocarpospora pleiomorpha]GES27490.1 hypothetical protein Aple_103900 [Acrocarpospora pleiomorpha]